MEISARWLISIGFKVVLLHVFKQGCLNKNTMGVTPSEYIHANSRKNYNFQAQSKHPKLMKKLECLKPVYFTKDLGIGAKTIFDMDYVYQSAPALWLGNYWAIPVKGD